MIAGRGATWLGAVVFRTGILVVGGLLIASCSVFGELEDPGGDKGVDRIKIREFDGDVLWSRAIDEDKRKIEVDELVPVDAFFEIDFDKSVDFESVRRNITLEELDGPIVSVDIRREDERVSIEPLEDLEEDTTHVLYIDDGIETESGDDVRVELRLEFDTE